MQMALEERFPTSVLHDGKLDVGRKGRGGQG